MEVAVPLTAETAYGITELGRWALECVGDASAEHEDSDADDHCS